MRLESCHSEPHRFGSSVIATVSSVARRLSQPSTCREMIFWTRSQVQVEEEAVGASDTGPRTRRNFEPEKIRFQSSNRRSRSQNRRKSRSRTQMTIPARKDRSGLQELPGSLATSGFADFAGSWQRRLERSGQGPASGRAKDRAWAWLWWRHRWRVLSTRQWRPLPEADSGSEAWIHLEAMRAKIQGVMLMSRRSSASMDRGQRPHHASLDRRSGWTRKPSSREEVASAPARASVSRFPCWSTSR